MTFSGALLLTDLNDFITPSQACIKPVETKTVPVPDPSAVASTQISVDGTGGYYEVNIENGKSATDKGVKLEKAQISLNDCLACSGCITSAESVLITMQSHEEVLAVLKDNPPKSAQEHRVPVLSISPQSIASLAATVHARLAAYPETSHDSTITKPSMADILARIEAFAVQELGFEYVFDTTFARHIALKEHLLEFQERVAATSGSSSAEGRTSLPMLASACPGWVCYAEKAHPEMLPFISGTKSPQQIMGTLVKEWIGDKLGKNPEQMYHVTVMPCYDKKLEASRQDFYNEQYRTRDVDCVITTGELELLLESRGWDLLRPLKAPTPSPVSFNIPRLMPHVGSSSGGWLQGIVEFIEERERAKGKQTSVHTKTIRTADYEEITVEAFEEGGNVEVVFRGAKCFGFRNLQNVVRKVAKEAGIKGAGASRGRVTGAAAALRARRAKASNGVEALAEKPGSDRPYDYVEVMACPAGCVNGGGQARRPIASTGDSLVNGDTAGMGARWGDREWVKVVEDTYCSEACDANTWEIAETRVKCVLDDLLSGCETGDARTSRRSALLRTQYRAVVSDVIGLNVKW
ncbi:hypothetical protein M408DRAFT_285408 [Serendipita vermifera MAFF 305830]|uniref:Cytosolic Fe-S cluster assembly factor NAR1 n=1 Tax=Serendipita vermifera MAFF 305830 TaxID=933852 RepID=A0A0C2XN54_SERVB|nr:hypothetical protein M408DRAFT_285408 [Serendipita vermifera MAFF 305830]